MSALRAAGLLLCWGAAAAWGVRAVIWIRGIRTLPDLLTLPLRPPSGTLSVIVPARNEEAAIEAGLRSLLASKHVDAEVIAVDDRSTDRTGAIIDALGRDVAEAHTLPYRALHIRDLAPGWLGKPHAMATGAEVATGEWLLFTDADVIFREDALALALSYLEQEGADHLLVVPTVVAASAGESLMLAFLHVLSVWGPQLWRVADPRARDSVGGRRVQPDPPFRV